MLILPSSSLSWLSIMLKINNMHTFLQIGHRAKSSTGIIFFFHPHGYRNGKISMYSTCCRWGRIRLGEAGSLPKATELDGSRGRLSVSARLTSHSGTPWHRAQPLPCASSVGVSYSSFKTPTLLRPTPETPVLPALAPAFGSPLDSIAGQQVLHCLNCCSPSMHPI